MRFEQHHFAELREHFAHRQEIAVPPPVVERGEHALALPSHRDQCVRFAEGNRERLVHDDMLARVQRRRRDFEMGCVRSRDHHQVGAL